MAVADALVLVELQARKVLGGQVHEAGADVPAHQVPAGAVLALGRGLDLQTARAEAELHDGLAAGVVGVGVRVGVGVVRSADAPPRPGEGAHARIVLLDLVVAGDADVDAALADEGGDVGGREEDESDGEVLDQGDVEPVFPLELDIGALEEVQAGGQ